MRLATVAFLRHSNKVHISSSSESFLENIKSIKTTSIFWTNQNHVGSIPGYFRNRSSFTQNICAKALQRRQYRYRTHTYPQ